MAIDDESLGLDGVVEDEFDSVVGIDVDDDEGADFPGSQSKSLYDLVLNSQNCR